MQSTYLKQQDLLWLKGSTPAAALTNLYFGLLDATDTEVTSTYATARATLASASAWSTIATVAGQREILSVLDVDFGNAIANGTIPKIGIYSALTGGSLIGILEAQNSIGEATPIAAVSGSPLLIPSGNLRIAFNISSFTTYFIDIKLNWLKGTNYPTPPTTLYAAIGALTRQAISWGTNVTVGENLEIRNTATLTFTNAGSEITVSTLEIYDALTSGNKIAETTFSSVAIATGESKQIQPSGVRLQV